MQFTSSRGVYSLLSRVITWMVLIAAAAYALATIGAGKNQFLDPQLAAAKLVRGMSIREACRALALSPEELEPRPYETGTILPVSAPGPITSYFSPESAIYLYFDSHGGLYRVWQQVFWRTNEWGGELPLGSSKQAGE